MGGRWIDSDRTSNFKIFVTLATRPCSFVKLVRSDNMLASCLNGVFDNLTLKILFLSAIIGQ